MYHRCNLLISSLKKKNIAHTEDDDEHGYVLERKKPLTKKKSIMASMNISHDEDEIS